MGKILGIDLGTTNSVMAIWDGREPRVLVNADGSRLTPSVVAFAPDGEVLVGQVARRQAVTNPRGTICSVKRFIGHGFDEVQSDSRLVSYEVVAGCDGEALVQVGSTTLTPAQISAKVLRNLKESAELFLGEAVEEAVITVPAHFNDAQRTATKEAGRLAGLEVRRIINEPTAAAMAYGLDKKQHQLVAVYDFGGGTFDISILLVGDDVIEVLATHGDTHLGGNDIDARIVSWLLKRYLGETGSELVQDVTTLQRLREAAEHAKIDLSSGLTTEINLPFVAAAAGTPIHFRAVLTRALFDAMISDLVDRTLSSCANALADAGKAPSDIEAVLLVGGSSRIPLVQRNVAAFFGKEPLRTVNPDEVVALGAAVQAGIMSGELKGLVLLDVTSLSLGVETHDGHTAVLIPRNTTIPTEVTRTFTTAVDGQTSVGVHVLQGESPIARANDSLGCFELDGVKPAPAGTPKIDVTFAIDFNGIVHASAHDRGTGRSEMVTVTARTAASALAAESEPSAARPWPSQPVPVESATEQSAATSGLPSAVTDVLHDAQLTLAQIDEAIPEGEKQALEEDIEQLGALIAGHAPLRDLDRSRSGLQRTLSRVKDALARRR
ncbi:MAG: molecular chaperone DnaK [Deltaproteobacteria bacterium]|nr:molecular chaperone DnaK [Deltaproteobacteria bacterium]